MGVVAGWGQVGRRAFLQSVGGLAAGVLVGTTGCAGSKRESSRRPVPAVKPIEGPGPATTAFMDALWDDGLGLIRFPFAQGPPPVRETSWYALGLLQRGRQGDAERARRAIETIIAKQYDSPGTLFHGSFPRFHGDPPLPPPTAVEFREFDPNWRQFIGTALALSVARFGAQLGGLRVDIERSVELAAAGERRDRVAPDYSNIALLHAWLLAETGSTREGETLAREIGDRYRVAGALDEHNSPTYDGVALYALSLWREEPPSPTFADLGEELYAGLWGNIGDTYHAGLRNVCGPYSRAVGMDLRTYSAVVGLWIWAAVGREIAPFPDLAGEFDHAGDVCFGPLVDLFAVDVPDSARGHLERFRGERMVRAGPAGTWGATSWLGERVMLGGHTGAAVRVGGAQLHPATVHWDQGWVRVRGGGQIDAVATPRRLELTCGAPGPATVTIGVPGLDPAAVAAGRWELPGLQVDVTAGAAPIAAAHAVPEGVEVAYPPTNVRLDVAG